MARRRRQTGEEVIQKLIREGRGQSELDEYLPWLNVRDVPSRGRSSRHKGWKTRRVHHFFSKLEKKYHNTLEWSKIVIDIREQYPLLPLEETVDVAKQCGFDHPAIQNKQDSKKLEPIVMTTDFFITLMIDGKRVERARTVKYADDLQSPRVLEKLEIERRYWEARGISWGIVTEHEIPNVLADNVENLYPYRYLDEDSRYSRRELYSAATALTQAMQGSTLSLRHVALDCDAILGFDQGTCLSIAYFLIANHHWEIDMYTPIQPGKHLDLKHVDLSKLVPGGSL
ncbi:MAG TPA: TnsA endonuclease N-terminal domain-containing protein [Ktedonobacteraceae bacterium]|nr:TnsA endonuclease N-terminal domain-containing protein [Ktedonobacteraceae bacterium]